MGRQLAELADDPEIPAWHRALISALQAILSGARDPALHYYDAAEILLLLEGLG